MPNFYGYEFDDPAIARGARQQGLVGMLYGMQQGRQDPNDWAGFLTGAATGFDKGYQGYLADYLPIHLRQQQEAEAEMERQRQEELAGRRVDWLQPILERMTGGGAAQQPGDFMGPEQGFGGPSAGDVAQSIPAATPPFVPGAPSESEFIAGLNQVQPTGGVQAPEFDYTIMPSDLFASQSEYADYLSGQLPQIQKTMAERQQAEAEAQQEAEMLEGVNRTLAGLGYSGPPIPDIETGLAVLKQYAEPEAEMTPYQQAQVARWGRQDAEPDTASQLTPAQQFTQQKYMADMMFRDDLDRIEREADEEAFGEGPRVDFRLPPTTRQGAFEAVGQLMQPAAPAAPGPSAAPTGTSPAPKVKTFQPEAAKRQTTATNIAASLKLPEAVTQDPNFLAMIAAELEAGKSPEQIRRELRAEAQRTGFWLGGRQ